MVITVTRMASGYGTVTILITGRLVLGMHHGTGMTGIMGIAILVQRGQRTNIGIGLIAIGRVLVLTLHNIVTIETSRDSRCSFLVQVARWMQQTNNLRARLHSTGTSQQLLHSTLARFDKKVPREGTNVRDGKGAGVNGVRKEGEGALKGKEANKMVILLTLNGVNLN